MDNTTKYVKLTKLEELPDALHPNNQPTGRIVFGAFVKKPTRGESFYLIGISTRSGQRGYITSTVQEILNETTFKTYNSIYKLEFIKPEHIPGFKTKSELSYA